MEIYQALSAVMADVGAVRKDSKNQAQGFNFRGIDSVVNAVSPALRKHGVIVYPNVISADYDTITVGNGKSMGSVRVIVEYTFVAKDGSFIASRVAAESFDSGDKATAKAMSVAFRTCLLQTLCLPTDEIDPDAESYERAAAPVARPKQGPKDQPFEPAKKPLAASNPGSLTKAQRSWVEKQAFGVGNGNTIDVVSNILGRKISDLDEVTAEEVRVLLPALSSKESQ